MCHPSTPPIDMFTPLTIFIALPCANILIADDAAADLAPGPGRRRLQGTVKPYNECMEENDGRIREFDYAKYMLNTLPSTNMAPLTSTYN